MQILLTLLHLTSGWEDLDRLFALGATCQLVSGRPRMEMDSNILNN